jgi:uncharacterized protein YbbC (DUF1343 family)
MKSAFNTWITKFIILLSVFFSNPALHASLPSDSSMRLGLEVLLSDSLHIISGKSIALLTNHTGVNSEGVQNIELIKALPDVKLISVLTPEHGFYGESADGEIIEYGDNDEFTFRLFSLYGRNRKPNAEMLKDVDILIYDIQDIGARYYTYISTMGLAMEAAAEAQIPFVVLDRPNPVGGQKVEGPVLDLSTQSFIGYYPIPIRYGLTCGELALAIAGEKWIDAVPSLTIIPMSNWDREKIPMKKSKWIKPSPNIPDAETALIYLGTCLIEGTNVSEGRGTDHPFKWIGAPWIHGAVLTAALEQLDLPGVVFAPTQFTPKEIVGVALNPKYEGEICTGISISITDHLQFKPVETGLGILSVIISKYPAELKYKIDYLTKLLGSTEVLRQLLHGKSAWEILNNQELEIKMFNKIRDKYLLYQLQN